MCMNKKLQRIKKLTFRRDKIGTVQDEILNLYDSASKLRAKAFFCSTNKEEMGKRLVNALISISRVADGLGITDLEYHLRRRMKELHQ